MVQQAQDAEGYRWAFANAKFDEARWELSVDGHPVELERKPLEVLAQLLRHAGEVLTKDELLETVWSGRIVVEAALTNAVGKLRRALGDEAQSLITTVARVGYRLEGPVSRKATQALAPDSVLATGDPAPRRPNYRLVERLARNEDSEVWRAEQPKTHEVRVFKFSLNGAQLPALKREVTLSRLLRDALGERAEYARVLDWDFEEAPYFVEFEYGGLSLDGWFAQQLLPPDRASRLAMMAEIADAVASAHEVGVLHKDLKPANVLVYGTSRDWHPRLTDFGSGRVLDAGRLEALGITQLGLTRTSTVVGDSGSGTPLYLAPEVIVGLSPSIKSDLYALGVILYQLLVGDFRRPLSPGWEADIDDQLLCEDIAACSNGDPARRPASARDLAERLRNLDARRLRHETEQAVQDRIAAGERKLALARARRPWIAAAILLLAAGMAGAMFYASRANKARLTQLAAQKNAQTYLAMANTLNDFLVKDVIGSANPQHNAGKQITVAAALEKSEAGISKRFSGSPGQEGVIRVALAKAYDGLSEVNKSAAQYEAALPLLARAYGAKDRRTIDAMFGAANENIYLGKIDEAKELYDQVARLNLPDPWVALEVEAGRSNIEERTGNWAGAVKSYQAQLKLLPRVRGQPESRTWKTQAMLGFALLATGDAKGATPLIENALKVQERILGPRHRDTMDNRQNYIQLLVQTHRLELAMAQTNRLLADKLAVIGPDKPDIANIHTLKGMILTEYQDFAGAAEEYAQAQAIFARTLSPDTPFELFSRQYRAENLRWGGRSVDAAAILQSRLVDAKRIFGDPSPALADYAMVEALACLDTGQIGCAHKMLPLIHMEDGKIAEDVDPSRKGKVALLQALLERATGQDRSSDTNLQRAFASFPEKSDYWYEVKRHMDKRGIEGAAGR